MTARDNTDSNVTRIRRIIEERVDAVREKRRRRDVAPRRAIDAPLAEAWRKFCGHFECVSIHHGSILDLDIDAVVSPANSFGFMDGGIDVRTIS
jgi:hypothetical protein